MFVGVCAAAAQRAAIPARASAGRSARTSHAGPRERVQPAYTFFTRSPLDTDWRATYARRPSAGGQSQFRSAFWAESSFCLQWKSQFSILFETQLRKTPCGWWNVSPPFDNSAQCENSAYVRVGRGKKAAESVDLIMFMGFRRDSRRTLNHEQTNLWWQKMARPRTSCFTSSDLRSKQS